jgi:predicted alpha/beta superfamily hydrolase
MEHKITKPKSRFGLFNTEAIIHTSVFTGEEYQVGIWLPFSFASSDQTYPVLYLTDGDYLFGLATGLVPTLIGTQEIPEILVVGIGYNRIASYAEFGKLREMDMLPPGLPDAPAEARTPQFLGFLEQELFPLIETRYRGTPDDRTLCGFSVGGFFSLYTMLTRPGLFKRYIATSGTWPGVASFLMTCEQDYARQSGHTPVNLHLSVGGLEEDQIPGFKRLAEVLETRDYPDFKLSTEIIADEIHGSGVIAQSFVNGLRKVYQNG